MIVSCTGVEYDGKMYLNYDPLQEMFDVYMNWGNEHCLSLNVDKTKSMW